MLARTLTILVLAPLVIWAILKLPPIWFMDITILIALWGAFEWTQFVPLRTYFGRFGYMMTVVLCIFAIAFFQVPGIVVLAVGLVGWLDALYLIRQKQKDALPARIKNPYYKAWLGIMVLVPFWVALNLLRTSSYGPIWLLYGLSIVWVADIAAYLVGRFCGKHKLADQVSPKKTWEGVFGGFLAAIFAGVIWNYCLAVPMSLWPIVLFMVALTAAISVCGDLFESLLKREMNIKDSGVLLPGHGGILDRIDALTIALPVFTLFTILFLL